ncbi:MAG: hypothetical protein ACP6IU_10295 [Candidatus Asgardarchaeia archaeon]
MGEPHKVDIEIIFRRGVTATIILEIIAGILMIGGFAAWVLNIIGITEWLTFDIQIFLLLLGAGVAFMIFLLFIGIFVRFHDRIQNFVVGRGMIKINMESREARLILLMYGGSITFLFIASVYGYYLIWKFLLASIIGTSISLTVFFFALGMFLVSFFAQLAVMGVSRYANQVLKALLLEEENTKK